MSILISFRISYPYFTIVPFFRKRSYILLSDGCLSIVSFGLFRRLGTLLMLPLPTTDLAAEIGLMAFVFQFLFLPNGLLLLGVLCVQNGIPDTWQLA